MQKRAPKTRKNYFVKKNMLHVSRGSFLGKTRKSWLEFTKTKTSSLKTPPERVMWHAKPTQNPLVRVYHIKNHKKCPKVQKKSKSDP